MSLKLLAIDWKEDWLNIERLLIDAPTTPYNSYLRHVISEQNNDHPSNEQWRTTIAELFDVKDPTLYALKVVDTALGKLAGAAIFNIHSSQRPARKTAQSQFQTMAGDFPHVCKAQPRF